MLITKSMADPTQRFALSQEPGYSVHVVVTRKHIVNHCPLQNICSVANTAGFLFDACRLLRCQVFGSSQL